MRPVAATNGIGKVISEHIQCDIPLYYIAENDAQTSSNVQIVPMLARLQ